MNMLMLQYNHMNADQLIEENKKLIRVDITLGNKIQRGELVGIEDIIGQQLIVGRPTIIQQQVDGQLV